MQKTNTVLHRTHKTGSPYVSCHLTIDNESVWGLAHCSNLWHRRWCVAWTSSQQGALSAFEIVNFEPWIPGFVRQTRAKNGWWSQVSWLSWQCWLLWGCAQNFQSCLNHDSYLIPFFGCICTLDFCYHTINLSDYHIFFRLKWFETRCLHVCTLSIQVIERVSAYPALRVGRNWPRTMHWWSQAGLMRMFCTACWEVSDIWGIWVQNGSLVHHWH